MKKAIAILIVLTLALTLLAACGPGDNVVDGERGTPGTTQTPGTTPTPGGPDVSGTAQRGGDLTLAAGSDLVFTASWMLRSTLERVQLSLVYEPLVRLDAEGNIYGFLAESIVPDYDNLTWTVTVRDNIYFSDGSQLDGEALLWNFENFLLNSNTSDTHFGFVNRFEQTGDFTVVIHLNQWTSQIPYSLQDNAGYMFSMRAFEEHGMEWALQNPVGTGPFVLEEAVPGEFRRYVRNENYWNPDAGPTFDSVTWLIVADESTAQAALLSGEIDGFFGPSFSMANTLLNRGGFHVAQNTTTFTVQFLVFPSAVEGPFADIRIRQAVSYAIDSELIVNAITYGFGIYSNQYAGPGTPFYNPNIVGYGFNPDRARELIAESDFADGFSTRLYMSNQFVHMATAISTIVQDQLRQVGIDLEVVLLEPAVWMETFRNAQDGFIIGGHGFGMNLANQMRSNFSHAAKDGVGLMSFSKLHPDDLNDIIIGAVSAPDTDTMIANVMEAGRLIIDVYCLAYPVFLQPAYFALLSERLQDNGWLNNTSLSFDYNNLHFIDN